MALPVFRGMLTDIVYSELKARGPGTVEELAVRVHEHVLPVRAALTVLLEEGRVGWAAVSVSGTGTYFAADLMPMIDAA